MRNTLLAILTTGLLAASGFAQSSAVAQQRPYDPEIGLGGKDVVWVPTPPALVEAMLDLAKVGRDDVVMDLGSGDGRTIIAAARRGARAVGIEYNPDLVALSTERAEQAGVAGRAMFVEGDMFAAELSRATVLALFLLPDNLERLRPGILALAPGTRVVLNTFAIPEWTPDETVVLPGCEHWCTALLYVVPAAVGGSWTTPRGVLTLTQRYQMISGTLAVEGRSLPVSGRLRGAALTLSIDGQIMRGTVAADRIDGLGFAVRRPAP
jgi:SAM-dependent methyltransferase